MRYEAVTNTHGAHPRTRVNQASSDEHGYAKRIRFYQKGLELLNVFLFTLTGTF